MTSDPADNPLFAYLEPDAPLPRDNPTRLASASLKYHLVGFWFYEKDVDVVIAELGLDQIHYLWQQPVQIENSTDVAAHLTNGFQLYCPASCL